MSSMHVLVVDDEPAVRQMLASIVRQAGYSVTEAGRAADAAAKLANGDFDVALCDIDMPDGNGVDLVRSCRASGIDSAFIMVSAFGSMETTAEALRAGAFDYIVKPVNSEEVLHRLSQIEAMHSLREENRVLRKAMSELENVNNQAKILAGGDRVTVADLPRDITPIDAAPAGASLQLAPGAGLRDQLRRFEAEMIRRAIEETGGDRRAAAQRLGIGLSSLYRKLEEFERLGVSAASAA